MEVEVFWRIWLRILIFHYISMSLLLKSSKKYKYIYVYVLPVLVKLTNFFFLCLYCQSHSLFLKNLRIVEGKFSSFFNFCFEKLASYYCWLKKKTNTLTLCTDNCSYSSVKFEFEPRNSRQCIFSFSLIPIVPDWK